MADREHHLGGNPRVTGTRISIEFPLECLACGMAITKIVEEYPTPSEDAITRDYVRFTRPTGGATAAGGG